MNSEFLSLFNSGNSISVNRSLSHVKNIITSFAQLN